MPCARLSRIRAFLSSTAVMAKVLRPNLLNSGGFLRGELRDDALGRLGLSRKAGALLQAALKLDDPALQLLDPTPLPVQGLEQAVKRLPNRVAHLLFHSSCL